MSTVSRARYRDLAVVRCCAHRSGSWPWCLLLQHIQERARSTSSATQPATKNDAASRCAVHCPSPEEVYIRAHLELYDVRAKYVERGKFYSAKSIPTEWKEGAVEARITEIRFANDSAAK